MIDLLYAAWLAGSVFAIWLAVVVWNEDGEIRVPESREKTLSTGDLYQTWKWKKARKEERG